MNQDQQASLLSVLQQQLHAARVYDQSVQSQNRTGTLIQVPGTGKVLSSAYEQLRNAAEYTEEHLLLQHAIRRFYNRTLFLTGSKPETIGQELIVELTHAGYLAKDSLSTQTAAQISQLAHEYLHAYSKLREAHVPRDKATEWVLSILSVTSENMLNPHNRISALAYVAYLHYSHAIPHNAVIERQAPGQKYDFALFTAIHQALLKSDIAVVRTEIMRMQRQSPQDIKGFIALNQLVDEVYTSDFTRKLKRTVSRQGAPFRILISMAQDHQDLPELLADRTKFLEAYNNQIKHEYAEVKHRVSKGIIKSIIFILITKVIIGVGVEVPFDLAFYGKVILLPLCVNLLVPPLYMASLKLGLRLPARSNARDLTHYADTMLYGDAHSLTVHPKAQSDNSMATNWLYSILFLVPFAITVFVLRQLHFNILQMVIFFVFLSTASFLGFRLSSMVRELELTGRQSGLFMSLRDFFYLPFILFGQWLSGKYAKINVVGYFLDIAIELPLKTVLHLIRQWTRFLNEKRDEIY